MKSKSANAIHNAKMREALKQIYDYAGAHGVCVIEAMAKAALSAPPDEPQPIIERIWPIIEVPYCDAIPSDYPGPMGVPISYMDKHDPDRFIILDHIKPKCRGKDKYERIVIVNKRFCTGRFQVYKKPYEEGGVE